MQLGNCWLTTASGTHGLRPKTPNTWVSNIHLSRYLDILLTDDQTTLGSLDDGKGEKINWWSGPGLKVHRLAGCDFCGMYPIIGDRYRCIDCTEKMGFDLCGDCYNTRSKLPGRFNQQHTPEHKFVLVQALGATQSYVQVPLENLELISEDPGLAEDDNRSESEATN